MSAEQRDSTPIRPIDERTGHNRSNSAAGANHRNNNPLQRPSADSDRQEPPLSYRIERTHLHVRIAALEQLVETSERRRQAVIDQYERLLTDRADDGETSVHESESQSRSLVARFVGR